jgi:hypothetical protein
LLRKHNKKLTFEIKIETSRGFLFAVRNENCQELMTATVDNKLETKKIDINEVHALLDIYQYFAVRSNFGNQVIVRFDKMILHF